VRSIAWFSTACTERASPMTFLRGEAPSEVAGAGFEPSPLTPEASSYRISETRDLA
jgi:hypothetical protein